MALTLTAVGFEYAATTALARTALRDLSISVSPGELVVVLGPSGSGKTTMLRLAAGLMTPTRGEVVVDGDRSCSAFRGVVGLAFQRPEAQFFAASVVEDVAFGPRNLGLSVVAAGSAARLALDTVGLDPDVFADRSPFTLSGGEARRVALAGVLAMGPRYLLLDEPTCGLDVSGRRAVARAIDRVRADAGVVVVTHDADEFLATADVALVLHEGAAVYSGSVGGLLASADRLESDGAWTPPEDVLAQVLAVRAGKIPGPPVLDPRLAASMLLGGVS